MPRSRNFYNLSRELSDRGADPRNALSVRELLFNAIDFIRGTSDRRANAAGGVLYIARVPGGQLWVDVSSPIEIPGNIELHLGSGVVLVPVVKHQDFRTPMTLDSETHHIAVTGNLRAPMARVFPTLEWFSANAGEPARTHDLGSVRFTSRWLDRVHPEWWGAGDRSVSASNDNAALDACVRAAVTERTTIGADRAASQRLRALPIELRGSYVLVRPLVIERSERIDDGIELRGAPAGDGDPTFVCGRSFAPADDPAMLVLRNFEAVTLDELRFDARGMAGRCLSLTSVLSASFERGTWLRRCSFRGATERLIDVSVHDATGGTSPAPMMASEDLRIEGCRFAPTLTPSSLPTALHVAAPPTFGVEVRGSLFMGDAAAMIHARSCALSVTNCQFSNNALPQRLQDVAVDDLHRDGPEGGVDIFLDVRPWDPTEVGSERERTTPATLYSQDCRSTSVQFLATCQRAFAGSGRDCSIIGLHHTTVAELEPIASLEMRRPPPADDFIIPDPIAPSKVATASDTAITKAPLVAKPLDGKLTPNDLDPLSKTTPVVPALTVKVTYEKSTTSLPVDLTALQKASTQPAPALPTNADFARTVGVLRTPGTEPIHWRIPSTANAWLTLTGCRFDGPRGSGLASVRGFAGCGPVGDLGVLSASVRAIAMDGNEPMTVPLVGT